MMSVIHKLAGRLFHRAGPCLGDIGSGEGRNDQPQEELEACSRSEFHYGAGQKHRLGVELYSILCPASLGSHKCR